MSTNILQCKGYILKQCKSCLKYMNPNNIDINICDETHNIHKYTKSKLCAPHNRKFISCNICNPYKCPCGRTTSNNPYSIATHKTCKTHIRFLNNKNNKDNIVV